MGQALQEASDDSQYRCDGAGKAGQPHCPYLNMEGLVLEADNPNH
jgi:hypothetical protein